MIVPLALLAPALGDSAGYPRWREKAGGGDGEIGADLGISSET